MAKILVIHGPNLNLLGSREKDIYGAISLEEINQELSSIEIRSNHGFLIVGIRHPNGQTTLNPAADTTLSTGDVVVVLGHTDDIPQLASRFSCGKKITYRGVTVDG